MINRNVAEDLSSNFRVYHGKLYAALLNQFGIAYVDDIEDVIQNTLLKAMRIWKPHDTPQKKENWLFIVAKNEMVNLINSTNRKNDLLHKKMNPGDTETTLEDLRLNTILFIATQSKLSRKAKVLLVLKNIFGLHVHEISNATLISEEAVHKLINRTKKKLINTVSHRSMDNLSALIDNTTKDTVEEILYAVFTIGFDSFDKKKNSVVNDDLCLESISLTKLLLETCGHVSTQNLLALLCFHTSRLPAKVNNGQLVSFADQKREHWNKELLNMAFHFLKEPKELHPFYLEALIISRHMSANELNREHWQSIVTLYKLWTSISNSPLIRLNMAYSLYMAGDAIKANELIESIKHQLPANHTYLSLVRAEMIKQESIQDYRSMVQTIIDGMDHELRKEYLKKALK